MALKVVRRKSTGAYTISGTVLGRRIQQRAQSNNRRLAEAEAAALETQILQTQWFGAKPASRTIGEAMLSYADAVPRSPRTLMRLVRLSDALSETTPLSEIDQDALTRLREKLLKPGASPATFTREIAEPLRAVLKYAARRGWCPEPYFILPKRPPGRTIFLMPAEAERLVAASMPHLRPLLIFLLGTGARVGEALRLDWADVDLAGGRAIFWETKSGRRRNATLPPGVVAALADLSHREGRVFQHPRGAYAINARGSGGQLRGAWTAALKGAGLDPKFTPHVCRHTFATWHYALHKDLLALKIEGGWASVSMVERYAKLMPVGYEGGIRKFLGIVDGAVTEPRRDLPVTELHREAVSS